MASPRSSLHGSRWSAARRAAEARSADSAGLRQRSPGRVEHGAGAARRPGTRPGTAARACRRPSRTRLGRRCRRRAPAFPATTPGPSPRHRARPQSAARRPHHVDLSVDPLRRRRAHQREAPAVRRPVRHDARGNEALARAVRRADVDLPVAHPREDAPRRPGRLGRILDDQARGPAVDTPDVEVGPAGVVPAGEDDPPKGIAQRALEPGTGDMYLVMVASSLPPAAHPDHHRRAVRQRRPRPGVPAPGPRRHWGWWSRSPAASPSPARW